MSIDLPAKKKVAVLEA